jgi:hypothetical protein
MKKIAIILILAGIASSVFAESLEDKLKRFGEENGKGYMQPFVNAMSANLNSGTFNTAKVLKPFRFGVYFNTMLAFVPDEDKTFTAKSPDANLYSPDETESATVWGNDGAEFSSDYVDPLKLPNGANLTAIPLMVPQVHLGLPAGNEIMLRFFPKTEINEKTGELSFFGVGLKHSLNKSILKLVPVDFALQATYQQFKLGDIVEMNSFNVNGQVSKKLLAWTFYGGLGYEGTELKADYSKIEWIYNPDTGTAATFVNDINFKLTSENDVRLTAGIRYSLLLMKFYADYSLCKYPVFNFGVGVSL